MKKLITILAIMIVVVGAAFAADLKETHTIQVKAIIDETLPAFQLYLSDSRKTNSTSVLFDNGKTYSVDAATTSDIDFTATADANRTATVVAKLLNEAKTIKSFTLTFSDGEFTVKKGANQAESVISPASITVTSKVAAATDGVNAITVDNTKNEATVQFNGTTCVAKDLVSVAYVYNQDLAINPGTYTANIVMTITTDGPTA